MKTMKFQNDSMFVGTVTSRKKTRWNDLKIFFNILFTDIGMQNRNENTAEGREIG